MHTRLLLGALVVAVPLLPLDPPSAHAATVTAAYTVGHRDVVINGYGTAGLGAFTLATDDGDEHAWCTEAHVAHTTRSDAYAEVPSTLASPELDALVWSMARAETIDDDTATAVAALVWFYSGARRSIGPAVWSDGSRGFAAISPTAPEPWDALAPLTMRHPVGLRAGGHDLDDAERRVADLHRWATAHRGPWQLSSGPRPGSFAVHGPGGPIAGATVWITLERPGHDDTVTEVRTASDGTASIALPRLDDGATVSARVESPGPHRAWDAPGDVQGLVTATTTVLTARTSVPPLPRHVEVRKTSSDPTLSPAGAVFELRDATGTLVDRGRTDLAGRLRFAPIDASRHPAPYTLVETAAPTGLLAAAPVTIASAATHPERPSIVSVVDHPIRVPVTIRKVLSVAGVGPADRSDFVFSITRLADGAEHTTTTGADGSAGPVALPFGEYRVCERAVPPWASALVDGGCRHVVVGADAVGAAVAVEYPNEVAAPAIDTWASDAADGDQVVSSEGGIVIDRVHLAGLVPGTTYRLTGAVLTATGRPTGVEATMVLAVETDTLDVELRFDLPPLPPGRYVVVEQLAVGDLVLTAHDALDDPDQRIDIAPAPVADTTTTTSATATTSTTTGTTTTTTTSTSTSTTMAVPPSSVPPTVPSPPTLPRTGHGVGTTALRAADALFVTGVGLSVMAALLPRRRPPRDARTAGRRSAPPFGR